MTENKYLSHFTCKLHLKDVIGSIIDLYLG